MRTRWLALAPALGLVLATAAQAAPTKTPQVTDPAGDAVGLQAGTDIVSVLYTTTGKGSGKSYAPKAFSVTLTLAGPAMAGPGLTYEVDANTTTCGLVSFTYEPGTAYGRALGLNGWADWGTCSNTAGDSSIELLSPEVEGNKITWTFGLKSTGLKVGTVFDQFEARVDPSNPAIPFPSSATGTTLGLIDKATGTKPWTLG
jgi:hypothetical protein